MIQINWKKFTNEYKTIKTWLEQNECENAGQVLLKIIALILRGEQKPEAVVAGAMSNQSIHNLITIDISSLELTDNLSEPVYRLLVSWIQSLPKDAALLGKVYEKCSLDRRVHGLYYTPAAAIDFIMKHTVENCDIVVNPKVKILDPACGCGYFLLKAYDILFSKFLQNRTILQTKYPDYDWSDEGIHSYIINYNLWGADIDPMAVNLTMLSLSLKRPEAALKTTPNIIVYDSLKRPEDVLMIETIRKFWSAHYDYVVGNPPYLSFGLRGTGRLEPQYRDYLRQAYVDSAEYKLSYYVLFMQRGIEMLVPNGRLGFIIPDSFLLGRYYSKIRRYIMEQTSIDIIAHIKSNVFANASTGYSIICILVKQNNVQRRLVNRVNIYQIEELDKLKQAAPLCRYEQSYFLNQPYYRFRIFFDYKTKKIIERIDSISVSLKNYATGHTGIRSLSRQSDIVSLEPQGDTWQRGLVSGSQISRYGLQYNGHWLNIDSNVLYKGGWRQEIVKQRKILVRQTGDTLIACIDGNGYYHLNNIHSFVLKGNELNLDYLLILLNSRLISFYYHATSMEYGRVMAQTDIETLELLPIVGNEEINRQASDLVVTMTNCVRNLAKGNTTISRKISAFDEYLHQLVYRIYNLTDDEIEFVERYEANLLSRSQRKMRR